MIKKIFFTTFIVTTYFIAVSFEEMTLSPDIISSLSKMKYLVIKIKNVVRQI